MQRHPLCGMRYPAAARTTRTARMGAGTWAAKADTAGKNHEPACVPRRAIVPTIPGQPAGGTFGAGARTDYQPACVGVGMPSLGCLGPGAGVGAMRPVSFWVLTKSRAAASCRAAIALHCSENVMRVPSALRAQPVRKMVVQVRASRAAKGRFIGRVIRANRRSMSNVALVAERKWHVPTPFSGTTSIEAPTQGEALTPALPFRCEQRSRGMRWDRLAANSSPPILQQPASPETSTPKPPRSPTRPSQSQKPSSSPPPPRDPPAPLLPRERNPPPTSPAKAPAPAPLQTSPQTPR